MFSKQYSVHRRQRRSALPVQHTNISDDMIAQGKRVLALDIQSPLSILCPLLRPLANQGFGPEPSPSFQVLRTRHSRYADCRCFHPFL